MEPEAGPAGAVAGDAGDSGSAPAVTTTGAQAFNDAVFLGADTTLSGAGLGFAATVDSFSSTARALVLAKASSTTGAA